MRWEPLPGAEPYELRCWQCGVEATGVAEITSLGDAMPRFLPTGWPAGDHEHEVTPPSPEELLARADRVMGRILAIAAE